MTDEITSRTRTQTVNRDAQGNVLPNSSDSETINRGRTAPTSNVDGVVNAPTDPFRSNFDPAASATIGVNPQQQAQAAVALHQELVLLDHYLDEAFDPCLYEAWLVRTRLVLTPYARSQPYDVYTRIYMSRPVGNGTFTTEGLRLVPLLVTDNFERSDTRRYEQTIQQIQTNLNGLSSVVAAGLGFNSYLNNLNALIGSQYNNVMTISQLNEQAITVRMGAIFSPTSRYEMQSRSYDITFLVLMERSTMEADRLARDQRRNLEYETRATAGDRAAQEAARRGEDAEAARSAALGNFDGGFMPSAMLARDDLGIGRVTFFAASEFRHAERGTLLPSVPNTLADDGAWNALMSRVEARATSPEGRNAVAALRAAPHGDPREIWSKIEAVDRSVYLSEDIYAELSRWAQTIYGSFTTVDMSPRRPVLPPPQVGSYRDALDGGVWARVSGSRALREDNVLANLYVIGSPATGLPDRTGISGPYYDPFRHDILEYARARPVSGPFVASTIRINPDGDLDLGFESLGGMGINPDGGEVVLGLSAEGGNRQCPASRHIGYKFSQSMLYPLLRSRISASAPPPSFGARAIAGAIAPAHDGTGMLRVVISPFEDRRNPYIMGYSISASSDIGAITGGVRLGDDGGPLPTSALVANTNSIRVGREFGAYNINLGSLKAGALTITVTALGADGAALAREIQTFQVTVAAPRTP